MTTCIIKFREDERFKGVNPLVEPVPTYSQVHDYLHNLYGEQINKDGKGACFRGLKGETAVLTDNSLERGESHEVVLIDMPLKVVLDLEKIIERKDFEIIL